MIGLFGSLLSPFSPFILIGIGYFGGRVRPVKRWNSHKLKSNP